MSMFKMASLADWLPLSCNSGELLAIELGGDEYRRCEFDFVSNEFVSVFAVSGSDAVLVACGVGDFSTSFSVGAGWALSVAGHPDAAVYYRTKVASQLIAEGVDPTFTSIEPRRAGPSDEVRRMMLIMRLNADRREAAMREEFQAAIAVRDASAVLESVVVADAPALSE